jgi:hypothetical protein
MLIIITDISPHNNGPGTPLLARPILLRLCSRGLVPRILPGAFIPRRHRCRHQTPASPSSRERHRVCGCIWREWSGDLPVRGRGDCTGEGGRGFAADCFGTTWGDTGVVVLFAEDPSKD